jgi:hypothetical protein
LSSDAHPLKKPLRSDVVIAERCVLCTIHLQVQFSNC